MTHYLKRRARRAPKTSDGRPTRLLVAAVAIAAVVVGAITYASLHHNARQTQNFHQTSSAGRSFSVIAYGADPTGTLDSTLAIRAAIAAAQVSPGNTVSFPAGTYTANRNDGATVDFVARGPYPIVIAGAGRDVTTVVEHVGLLAYPTLTRGKDVFWLVGAPRNGSGGADGSAFTGMTVDSQTYDAGTTVISFANHTTISHSRMLGARSYASYNLDVFDVRIIAVCNRTDGVHHSFNTVDDLILNGRGQGGNVDLDFSCEWDGRITNLVDTGNGIALYIDRRVTLDGMRWSGGLVPNQPHPWYLTGPTDRVTLANVISDGQGGVVKASQQNDRVTNLAIVNETMTNLAADLAIGDATTTAISGSALGVLRLDPAFSLNGLAVSGSTEASVACRKAVTITGLTGVTCPPA